MSDISTVWSINGASGDWALVTTQLPISVSLFDEASDDIEAEDGSTLSEESDQVLSVLGDLVSGNDLQTAILVSLFTDAQAAPDDIIPDGSTDTRGWWGDLGAQSPIGSKLWLLGRSKQTPEVLIKAKQYAQDALQWLLDDGVVGSITVEASYPRATFLALKITITRSGKTLSLEYAWVWQGVQ